MDTFYGYDTTLWYWRLSASRNRPPHRVMRSVGPDSYAWTECREHQNRPNWLDPELVMFAGGKVHVLVFHRNRRNAKGGQVWHLWERVPRDAFSPAGEHSFVASPEFCFLQMASKLDFLDLVLLGMEFCGLYTLDPRDEAGFAKRTVPLTNRARILAFLEENRGARGRRNALTALQYVVDGAASPMEAAVVMLLTLPYKRGGYHLPRPSLNYRIDLNRNASKLAGKSRCYGDICWPDDYLDVEYLGLESHDGDANMLADRSRTLAIEEMGYEVVEITKEQATDIGAFDIVAGRIAAKLGKRIKKEHRGVNAQRLYLFDVVYRWDSAEAAIDELWESPELEEDVVFGRRS